jgi:hypothetical protein
VRPESVPFDAPARIRAIADSSVGRWSVAGDNVPDGARTRPAERSPAEQVLRDVIRREANPAGVEPVQRVDLHRLRAAGLSMEAVRELGSELARQGRLLRRGRDARGSFWELAAGAGEN